MPEETLLSFEETRTRAEIADRLRSLADGLDGDGSLALAEGDQRVELWPPENLEFELEVEREYEEDEDGDREDESEEDETGEGEENGDGSSELSIEVEIEWEESDADAGSGEQRSEDGDTSKEAGEEIEAVNADAEAGRDDGTGAVPIEPDQEGVPAAATGEIETAQSLGQFQLYVDRGGKWRWRLVHRNGNIIAASGQGYASKQKARQGMSSVMRNAPDAAAITLE